jgi:hypothetical protein
MLQPISILSIHLSRGKAKCPPANDFKQLPPKINPNENLNKQFMYTNYYTFNAEIKDK